MLEAQQRDWLKQRNKAASIWVLLFYIIVKEQKFSWLSYKREKKFPTLKNWSNRPILMLTFFYFDISNPTDTFITDNWGEREDTQKVLVAICTLEYFSWLYTLIFVQMFFFISSSLEPLLFIPWKRTFFFKVTLQTRGNILCRKMDIVRRIQVQQQTTNKRYLIFQSQYRLVAAFI